MKHPREDACPLCEQANACAMVQGNEDCWCREVKVDPRALAAIPAEQRNQRCLCQCCATRKTSCDSTVS